MQGQIMRSVTMPLTVKNSTLLFILITFILMGNVAFPQARVAWNDYDSGIRLSKKTNRIVFIFFYADWCAYCKMMDDVNFTDAAIAGSLNNNFIPIRLNVDSGRKLPAYSNYTLTPKELFNTMSGSALPYMVFTDSAGGIITGIPGYIKKEIFNPLLKYIAMGCYNKNITFEEYLEGSKKCTGN